MSRHYHNVPDGTKVFFEKNQYIQIRRRQKNYGEFRMSYQEFIRYVTLEAPDALPTLHALTWLGDVQNQSRVSHEQLSREIGKSIPTVARHMKRLRELGVVANEVNVPYACYRIHPLLAWRGKVEERNDYIEGLGRDHPFTKLIQKLVPDEIPPVPDDEEEDE